MGKELSLARKEEERLPVLLASTGSGELIKVPSSRDERKKEATSTKGNYGEEVKDTKTKSKGCSKTKRAYGSTAKKSRRGRDNKDRKQDRGDEGEDNPTRRSAQELGITFPGSYCDELETTIHYWSEAEKIHNGSLYQCKFCHKHLWLPLFHMDAMKLDKYIKQYGSDEGYCRFLNHHRPAKILIAKMIHLRKLEAEMPDKREFAKMADEILSDREYDRKEV